MERPLADEIRPQSLDEVVGQRHLLGPNGVLRRIIESGVSANMVFYGPSGTGKTTIANLIAQRTHRTLYRLNATTASLQDIKDIIADVGTLMAPGGALLYLDEIQYFNKKQQQSLLEFMENGKITDNEEEEKEEEIQKTIDDINQKFGKSIVAPASLKIIGNPKSKRNLKD